MNNNPTFKEHFTSTISQLEGYEVREHQLEMATAVQEALKQTTNIIIEAGTGSGKSFAYLIPALSLDKRIVISTGTIALQEQLLNKDIPFILNALQKDVQVALAKGRGNYLCIHKLTEHEREMPESNGDFMFIKMLREALNNGWNGDYASLDFNLPERIWYDVKSDSEDCLGKKCPFYSINPYKLFREELAKADVIISNHALYFTDLASSSAILPAHEYVIFDEAHQLRKVATSSMTVEIGRYSTTKVLQRISKRLLKPPDAFISAIANIDAEILNWIFARGDIKFKLDTNSEFNLLIEQQIEVLEKLKSWINDLELEQLSFSDEFEKMKLAVYRGNLLGQVSSLIARYLYFLWDEESIFSRVNWVEVERNKLTYKLLSAPLSVAGLLENSLWSEKVAVLTSATLTTAGSTDYVKNDLGITQCDTLILPSIFDYRKQALLFLPEGVPDPNDPFFVAGITPIIKELIQLSNGKALVLFTSNRVMQDTASSVLEYIENPVKVQGDMPRNKLIEWFKNTENSVLFATATFWEGIDIPGDDLINLIIDKIPFPMPDDPVISSIVNKMKAGNQNWFGNFMLPEAILKLKQGFGRLIRTKSDKGVVTILDPRLKTKGYGRTIVNSLPDIQIVHRMDEVKDFFTACAVK